MAEKQEKQSCSLKGQEMLTFCNHQKKWFHKFKLKMTKQKTSTMMIFENDDDSFFLKIEDCAWKFGCDYFMS